MTDKQKSINSRMSSIEAIWSQLVAEIAPIRSRYTSRLIDRKTGERREVFAQELWMTGAHFEDDVKAFVEIRSNPS
jgi:hypothetical protein